MSCTEECHIYIKVMIIIFSLFLSDNFGRCLNTEKKIDFKLHFPYSIKYHKILYGFLVSLSLSLPSILDDGKVIKSEREYCAKRWEAFIGHFKGWNWLSRALFMSHPPPSFTAKNMLTLEKFFLNCGELFCDNFKTTKNLERKQEKSRFVTYDRKNQRWKRKRERGEENMGKNIKMSDGIRLRVSNKNFSFMRESFTFFLIGRRT